MLVLVPLPRCPSPMLAVLAILTLTACSSTRPPSATGLCPALVPEVIDLSPDERAATPAAVKRKIVSLNAAVLGACGLR